MNKKEDKKEMILLAGMEVMKSNGYNGTSVKDIVDAADIPKGSFYNYFDSKEEFAIEAIDHCADEGYRQALSIFESEEREPIDRLIAFFDAGIYQACSNEFRVGCFLGNMCQEMSDSSEAIASRLRYVFKRLTHLIADVLIKINTQRKDAGIVINLNHDDAYRKAEFILSAWQGALMRAKVFRSRDPLDAFLYTLPLVLC